jgi:hypothetical protein
MNLKDIQTALEKFRMIVEARKTLIYNHFERPDDFIHVQKELSAMGHYVFYEYFDEGEAVEFYGKEISDVSCLEPLVCEVMDELAEIVFDVGHNYEFDMTKLQNNLYLRSGIQFFIDWHSSELTEKLKPFVEQFDHCLNVHLTKPSWSNNALNYFQLEGPLPILPLSHVWWTRYQPVE